MLEPGLGIFELPAFLDALAEQPVPVADAVAGRRHPHRRHALHEAGREPPQPAIAQRRIRLELRDHLEIDAKRRQRRAHRLEQPEVGQRIAHQPPDEEFEAEVIDALRLAVIGGLGRLHPALDGPVAGNEDGRLQPVVFVGGLRVLADPVGQPLDDLAGEVCVGLSGGFQARRMRIGVEAHGWVIPESGAQGSCRTAAWLQLCWKRDHDQAPGSLIRQSGPHRHAPPTIPAAPR